MAVVAPPPLLPQGPAVLLNGMRVDSRVGAAMAPLLRRQLLIEAADFNCCCSGVSVSHAAWPGSPSAGPAAPRPWSPAPADPDLGRDLRLPGPVVTSSSSHPVPRAGSGAGSWIFPCSRAPWLLGGLRLSCRTLGAGAGPSVVRPRWGQSALEPVPVSCSGPDPAQLALGKWA